MSVVGQNEILELTIKQSVIENAVKTYAFSKKYIRMAVKAVLINVLYHRLNFPDNLFNNKKFHDVPYMAFKTDVKHRIIGHYSKWMKGFQDAFDKDYVGALLQEQPVSEYEANDVVASGSFVEADKNPVGSNKSATEFNKSLIVLDDLDVKEDIDVHTINSSETPYETVTDSLFCGDISLEMERVGDCSFNVSHIASSNGGKENVEPPRFLIRSNKDSQYLERDTPESMGIKRKIALKGTPRKMRRLSQ